MAFENILRRLGRNRSRNRQIVSIPQQDWRGVNAVDGIYSMPAHQIPPAQNVDLGSPVGSISKVAGYESLFPSLGAGPSLGLHAWKHPDGDKLIYAWDKNLYLLSGSMGSISKSTREDWEAGTGNNIDTASSPGDVRVALAGEPFSETATATADFDGTHDQTEAVDNAVKLDINPTSGSAKYYIQNAAAGYNPTAKGAWDRTSLDCSSFKLSKTKSGSITSAGGDASDSGADTDMLLIKAVSDPLPTTKTISGTLSWCLGVRESSSSYNMVYHIHVWVTQGNSSTVRGTLLNDYVGSIEWPSTAAGLSVSAQALSSVNAQAGDRIVIEIGCKSGALTEYYGRVWYGGTGNDLTDGGDVTTLTGWFRFSQDPADQYYTEGTYTHGEQDISGIVNTTGVTISYNKTTPSGTTLTVQTRTSTNGGSSYGSWTTRSSGATIVASGIDVSDYRIQWRAILQTTDVGITPTLNDVTIEGDPGYAAFADITISGIDMGNTPITANISFTATEPEGTSVSCFVRGSPDGKVYGDWWTIAASGGAIPLLRYSEVKFELTGTVDATPALSSFLISYSSSYTKANRLDISPLGRVDNNLTGNRVSIVDYEDRLYCADGLRPFVLYVDDSTAATGTAQAGAASTISLAAGASAVGGFYNNAFITITSGTGAGQVRFISDYNGSTKIATVSEAWDTVPDGTSKYSISPAVKVRNAGVDPPTTACSGAAGESGSLSGNYRWKYTFVNRDGYESNPSPASGETSLSSKKGSLTNIATGDSTIVARKIYRTKAGGSVYHYVATIENNTATTYTDNTADSSLTVLMLDNNNIPPNCSLVYSFLTYMFYAFKDELWYSKATEPESVPAIVNDVQNIICPGTVLDIKSNPMALIPMGEDFIAPITSNSGFIFDSDPTVDTTTMRQIGRSGSTSAWASDICVTPDLRSILTFPTRAGVMTLLPGLQEESIESIPLSRNVQTYFDRAVDRESMAGIFHNGRYRISFKYLAPGASEAVWVTFVCDFRQETREWSGPWTYGASCYAVIGGVLYAGDPEEGKVYLMDTGSSFDGEKIHMIADTQMLAPQGENFTYKFNKFMVMVSAESDTSELVVKPKVDDREVSVVPGRLEDTFTGDKRPGHDNIRSRKYRIPLAKGNTLSLRFEDDSTNPLCIQKVVTEAEVLPLKR